MSSEEKRESSSGGSAPKEEEVTAEETPEVDDEDDDEDPDTPKTSKDAVKMCKRRRKKVKTVRIEVASNAADGQDPNAPNISASAAQATLDKLAKTEYYTDEVCGEDDDGEIECYRLDAEEGNDDVITKEDEIGGEDDDWDYYYVPCDPAVDGEEEDEGEGKDEDDRTGVDVDDQGAAGSPQPTAMNADEGEQEEEEEEEEEEGFETGEDIFKTLFMSTLEDQQELEFLNLADIEGVVGITLSSKTKQFFEIEDEEMFQPEDSEEEPVQVHKWLSWKKIKLHIFLNGEESEFFEHYNLIKYYPDVTMLFGSDPKNQTGHKYFLCLTIEARNNVLNPKRRKRLVMDLKAQQEQVWNEMASIAPRKWRGYGSEVEVDEENVLDSRPLLSVQVYRYREYFGSKCKFEDAQKTETNAGQFSASFKAEPTDLYPCVHTVEVDRAIQVNTQRTEVATQTGFSFKRNKMVQYGYQSITDKNVENIMGSRNMAKFFRRVMPRLVKVLQQNEMVDLLHDDYRNLKCKRGHEMEFSTDSLLLQEYQTYSDLKHSKGRIVTCLAFHPALEDVVVIATAVDLTWERRIDAHSKSLMEPNYVLFWDLRDSAHPQIMLDAPADVFSFQVNPSDPSLVCGGCANGQVALWDLGRTYFELRAKIQDRTNMGGDTKTKRPSFLDKLKDSAETLACPLIQVAGLSNLDSAHKRAVTSVVWLPHHIEVGKNGIVYDNNAGRSQQFMSVAGDGTLRLWDTRPQNKKKEQAEDDDEDGAKDLIKVNKWAHLENNQWKFHFKYNMEDSRGSPIFVTKFLICEKRATGGKKAEDDPSTANSLSQTGDGKQTSTTEAATNPPETTSQKKVFRMFVQNLTALTTLFVGAETGEIGLVDWLRNSEGVPVPDFSSKTMTNTFMETFHHGAITCIRRSPFYPEMLLVVGGGTISIWKETCPYPIFLSGGFDVFPWCAVWSNSRPAVFYIGNREGSVSVWDLMDRSNGPVMTQPVTNASIIDIGMPLIAASASKNQYLGIGDSEGTLLVLLLPRFYARPLPNENHVMTELMNREDNRMTSWMTESDHRADKIQAISYNWKQSRLSKSSAEASHAELEQEARLSEEYVQFVEFEQSLIGALKENEPSVPTMDGQMSGEFDAIIAAAHKEQEVQLEDDFVEDDDDWDRDFDDDDDDYD